MSARLLASLMLATSLLAACGDEARPAAKPAVAAPPPAAAATPAAAVAGGDVAFAYSYSPVGKRDPFRSPVEEVADKNAACQDPLCQWDLDQLSLVAIVTGDSSPIAMVEDPQGRGHIVHRNSRMGKQEGKVTQILRDSLTITEYWRQPDGKLTPNPVTMQLKKGQTTSSAQDLATGREM